MDTKAKGSRAERRAMRLLSNAGYRCTRSSASLGAFDVIAVNSVSVRFIQVKAGDRCQVRPLEREAIEMFAVPPNCSREIWKFYPRRREPVIEQV